MRGRLGLFVIAIGVAGCNPPPPTTVSDVGPRVDSGPLPQPVVTTMSGTLDLSCVGHMTIPTSTTMVAGTLHVGEFLSMAPITSTRIDIFADDVVADTCTPPTCTSYTTDSAGNFAVTLPSGSWFAYRLAVNGQTAAVIGYNQPWITAGGTPLPVYGFAPSTISQVGMLFMRTFQADRLGSMSGRTVDCAGNALAHVRVRVFVGDTEVLTGPLADQTSPRIAGLEGTSPTRSGLTGPSGNFAGANVPPSDDSHVETWATLTEGTAPQLIGCSQGRVLLGGITLALIGGLRSDYPAGSRCAVAAAAAMR